LPPLLNDAKAQDKMEALNLSIGIKSQKKFENLGQLNPKNYKTKKLQNIIYQIQKPYQKKVKPLIR
jgi:hypothetical protein